MTERFGDWVNEAWEDENDWDDEDEADDPLDPMRFDPWRGFLIVPGEYADDDAPEDDGIPFAMMDVPMTDHWRRCPACGCVETIYAGGEFWRDDCDDCDQCNPIPF